MDATEPRFPLTSGPLALDPRAVASIRDGSALKRSAAKPVDSPMFPVDGEGIATLEVSGPLAQRAVSFLGFTLWDGYDEIAQRFCAALADDNVRGVLVRFDSPGGTVAGLFEALRQMNAAKASTMKPVVGLVDEFCASAAYALATTCDMIVTPETGYLGSIGVIATLTSVAQALSDDGIDVRVIASGDEKTDGHPAVEISDGAVKRVRADVEALAKMFAQEVAARRGMTVDQVLALNAGIRRGQAAVDAKLANYVGGIDTARSMLRAWMSALPSGAKAAAPPRTNATTETINRVAMAPPTTERKDTHMHDNSTALRSRTNGKTFAQMTNVEFGRLAVEESDTYNAMLAECRRLGISPFKPARKAV